MMLDTRTKKYEEKLTTNYTKLFYRRARGLRRGFLDRITGFLSREKASAFAKAMAGQAKKNLPQRALRVQRVVLRIFLMLCVFASAEPAFCQ